VPLLITSVAAACATRSAPTNRSLASNHEASSAEPAALRRVDWRNRRYNVAAPDLTPQYRQFVDGVFDNGLGESDDREVYRIGKTIYDDVTGDGVDEVLVELIHDQSVFRSPSLIYVIVIAGDAERQSVLDFVYLDDCRLDSVSVTHGIVEVISGTNDIDGQQCDSTPQILRRRWNGHALIAYP
jgi:hypothetical protein